MKCLKNAMVFMIVCFIEVLSPDFTSGAGKKNLRLTAGTIKKTLAAGTNYFPPKISLEA